MIKKFIKYFYVFYLLLFSFSIVNATGYIYEFNKFSPSQVNSVYEVNVFGNGNLRTSFGGVVKNLIWWNNGKYFFWQENGLPYYRFDNNNYGTIKNYYICPKSTTFDYCTCSSYPCSCSRNIQYYCNSDGGLKTVGSGTVDIFKSYLGLLNNNDSYYYMEFINGTQPFLCFIAGNSNNVLCFNGIGQYISHENGEVNYGSDFDNISDSILFNPPYNNSGGGNEGGNSGSGNLVGIALSSTGGAIDFYENRVGLNKDICYVGVNSMSTLYGTSGISFNQGGGLTIFDAFQTLYGSTGLNEVYVWINNWILNYEQWFGNDGNPMFLSNYNSGTNQVDIYYDNLTFPFADNPVAVYFMASYIEQVFANGLYNPSGSAVVSYCNLKINNGTFEEIIDNSDKVSINNYIEKENIYKGLNSDGTEKDYGAWLSSGVNIAFSGNTSIKDTLINFLDETEESIKSLKGNTGSVINGHILPSWLIGAFLFFALFKFIRKR